MSSAWDRRALREQRRTAALAARQQRALYRAQMRAMRRGSVLGPLLLVTLGILFLLIEIGNLHPDTVWLWSAHWWPLVLVGAGLVLLAEWGLDSWHAGRRSVPLPRRSLGTGSVLLLILFAVVGFSAMRVHDGSAWMRRNWDGDVSSAWGLDQLFAQHSVTEDSLSAPLASGALLTIQNYRGAITVSGTSQDGQVHVSTHQQLVAWQNEDLRARKQQDQPRLESNGSGLLLRIEGEGRDQTDLTLEIPHQAALEIAAERGELSVSELRGPLTVNAHKGNIVLTGLTGNVQLKTDDDNATITGHSLSGNLNLEGRSGDVALSDVTGSVTLHGDFFGTTHLERIQGPVHFQSSFTELACAGIAGELDVEGRSELQGHNLEGPFTLTTTDRSLTLTGVHRGALVNNRNGSVKLSLADPLGSTRVTTSHGFIDLTIPDRAAFAISAETTGGQTMNDFGLASQQRENRSLMTDKIRSGGPNISLQTSNGNISVHKSSMPEKVAGSSDPESTDSAERDQ